MNVPHLGKKSHCIPSLQASVFMHICNTIEISCSTNKRSHIILPYNREDCPYAVCFSYLNSLQTLQSINPVWYS